MLVFMLPGADLYEAVSRLVGRPTDPQELHVRIQALYPDVRVQLEACGVICQPEAELRHAHEEPEQLFDMSALHAAVHVIRHPTPPRILA